MPLVIVAEQWLRAWKWRQLLHLLRAGIVFAFLVPVALLLVVFPDPAADIRASLAWAAAGSLVLFGLLIFALIAYKRDTRGRASFVVRLVERLPVRLARPLRPGFRLVRKRHRMAA